MKPITILPLLSLLGLPVTVEAHAAGPVPCTTFCFAVGGQTLFGRNYDWSIGSGFLTVNKRGLAKTAPTRPGEGTPARWRSTFGSLTFNQYGREFPAGGINEAGLVVETMWLPGTRYPDADHRPALATVTWVQYQLDTARNVDDVVRSTAKVRIAATGQAPVHFLVSDRSGGTATVEFLDGRIVVHRGDDLPFAALTNDRYSKSVGYLKLHEGYGGTEPIEAGRGSLDRFCRAVAGARSYRGPAGDAAVEHAFSVLGDVSQGSSTQWSIVYDLQKLRVYWRTAQAPAVKYLDLASCDFSTRTPCAVLDVQSREPGDASGRFTAYTTEANRAQVLAAIRQTRWPASAQELRTILEAASALIANYPASIDAANAPQRTGKNTR